MAKTGKPAWNRGLHKYMGGVRFVKGQVPWNKNKTGIHLSPKSEFVKGQAAWNKKESDIKCDTCGKVSHKKPSHISKFNFCNRKCHKVWQQKHMKEIVARGEKAGGWRGGVCSENEKQRKSVEMRLWREAVFARDGWICRECNTRGGKLHPHHIKSFAKHPELRFAIDNGLTLCERCHKKTGNYGRNGG